MAIALSRSCFGTSIGVMTSHAGAARAPLPPRQNAVASSTAGVAQCIATIVAKTIDIAVTAICAPISILRASMMSVSAPAGRVRRNIGRVVATCTADTIIGSGLRLVMSQFDEVSNIANPTFDAELAISMTVNAKLPKTPQRQSPAAGASDLAVDSLDNKIPIGRARNWVATTCPISRSNGEQRAKFQGAAVRKANPATYGCGCSKSELQGIQSVPAATSSPSAQNSFNALLCRGYWSRRSAPPRTRQISRACGSCRSRIPLNVVERKTFSGLLWRAQMTHLGHSRLRAWAFGGVTQDLLAR